MLLCACNRYLHGDTTTPMGKQRAADGHPSTYGGFWFELGNEQTVPLFGAQVNVHRVFVTTVFSAQQLLFYLLTEWNT